MSRTPRKLCSFVIFATAIVAACVFFARSRTPAEPVISGGRFIDLGEHFLGDAPTELTHTFRLTNETGRQLNVRKVSSTCGCTEAQVSSDSIAPGAAFEVLATLKLSSAGRRAERVTLVSDEIEPVSLELVATGKATRSFYVTNASMLLALDVYDLCVVQVLNPGMRPPRLTVISPEGVSAIPGDWELVYAGDVLTRRPARWHLTIRVQMSTPEAKSSDPLVIQTSAGDEARVSLNGRPWV